MSTCVNCSSELPERARICPNCSHPVDESPTSSARPSAEGGIADQVPAPPAPLYARPPTDGLAIASLVCGILGFFIPIVLSIVAVVLGKMSRDRIAASGGTLEGGSMATAGFVLGIIGIVLGVLMIALFATVIGVVFSSMGL